MGIQSRAYLRALIIGEKPLRENILPMLLKGIELGNDEISYFAMLFRHQTAPNQELAGIYLRDIFSAWIQNAKFLEPDRLTEFLSDSLVPVLFTYLSFDDGHFTVKAAAKDLATSSESIIQALRCLFASGIANGEINDNGEITYRSESALFKIPPLPGNQHLKNFHLEGLRISRAAADMDPSERKMFSSFFCTY